MPSALVSLEGVGTTFDILIKQLIMASKGITLQGKDLKTLHATT